MRVKSLAKHLRNKHGNISSGVQVPHPAAPQFPRNSIPVASSSATPLLWAPGEVRYPSIWTNGPLRTNEVSATVDTRNLPLGRFYCQEHDCGRGFSSEAHLKSHAGFFHQKRFPKTTEGERGVATSPNIIPEEAEGSTKHSPTYLAPTVSSSDSEEHATRDSSRTPSPVESPVPALPRDGHQIIYSGAGMSIQDTSRSMADSPTATHDEVSAPPAAATLALLSLQCRICDAPPTVDMRPTATMCGHVFCYECITQHVMSTPRCPVCNGALLLYCLFKLDLPVLS